MERHDFLRYLLLENNKIKKLPNEIANLRYLTALNLIDNPIEYPPTEIVQKGCKAIQEYLKNDVWASDEENEPNDNIEKYTTSSASYNNKNKLYRMNSNMMENNSYLNYKE